MYKISKSEVRLIEEEMEGNIPTMTPSNTNIRTINLEKLKGLQEVPEESIIQAAHAMGNTPNSFHMLLMTADIYKGMNTEPVYLINKTQDALTVAPREIWENPLKLN